MESTVFHPARCRRYLCLLWLALCLCTVAGTPAHADHPVPATIKDYWHSSWRQHDGAPSSIWAIAQTPDGWLWLATPSGLYRFDGVNFEAFDLLPDEEAATRRDLRRRLALVYWRSYHREEAVELDTDPEQTGAAGVGD